MIIGPAFRTSAWLATALAITAVLAAADGAHARKGATAPSPTTHTGPVGIKAPKGKMVDERLDPCRRPHGGLHGCRRN